jgi:hypothetical protein
VHLGRAAENSRQESPETQAITAAMPILASVCTAPESIPSCLILIEDRLSKASWIRLPDGIPANIRATGIALDSSCLYIGLQGLGIAAIRRRDFTLVGIHVSAKIRDVHSLLAEDGDVLAVSSGNDSIRWLGTDNGKVVSEDLFWALAGAEAVTDLNHINSICRWRDGLLVSGLGPKADTLWSTAVNGFVKEIPSGRSLVEGVAHPHSLVVVGDAVFFCESARGLVKSLFDGRQAALDGYTRGLCMDDGAFYAATSVSRRVSKSEGVLLNTLEAGDPVGRCAILRLRPDDLAIQGNLDLTAMCSEIYEIIQVGEDAVSWPTV